MLEVNIFRILSAESGCGCAKPVVRPEVMARPGRRSGSYCYDGCRRRKNCPNHPTDGFAPIQPEVPLDLKLVGTRKPPFSIHVEGEAVFRGNYSPGMGREIAVTTVENREPGELPDVSADLPFLRLTPKGVEEKPYIRQERLSERGSTWSNSKIARLRDPSSKDYGQESLGSERNLDIKRSGTTAGRSRGVSIAHYAGWFVGSARASLTVVCDSPSGKLDFELDPSSHVPLIVEEEGGDEARRVHRVAIRLDEVDASDYGADRLFSANLEQRKE